MSTLASVELPKSYTIRCPLRELGVRWKRAKHWITSPDPDYLRKNHCRDRLLHLVKEHTTWALGFADEVWWSRLAQPAQHGWQEQATPIRLQERTYSQDDPDPKALACYGLLLRQRSLQPDQMRLAFCRRASDQCYDHRIFSLV